MLDKASHNIIYFTLYYYLFNFFNYLKSSLFSSFFFFLFSFCSLGHISPQYIYFFPTKNCHHIYIYQMNFSGPFFILSLMLTVNQLICFFIDFFTFIIYSCFIFIYMKSSNKVSQVSCVIFHLKIIKKIFLLLLNYF